MAAVTLLGSDVSTSTGAKTVTATPAVGDLIFIAACQTGSATLFPPVDDAGGSYTLVTSQANGSGSVVGIYVRDSLVSSASSTVFSGAVLSFGSNGGGIAVLKVTGMALAGIDAIRQYKSSAITAAAAATGTWPSAKLTQNTIIGLLGDTSGAVITPNPSSYVEALEVSYTVPNFTFEIQTRDSGSTSAELTWDVATMTGEVLGVELDTSSRVVLNAASFGFTAQNVAPTKSTTLSAPALTFVANTQQLRRTNQIQIGSLDFNRQVFQIATVNNQAADTFDFVQPDISVGNSITLSAASVGFVADTVQFAVTSNIAEGSLNLTGEPTEQIIGTTLSVAAMDFVGIDLAPVQIVALDPATFEITAQTATPAAVITLVEEPMDFVVLDVNPSNAPLGEVVNLVTVAFDFAVSTIRGVNSITLDTATFGFAATEISSTSVNNLAASDLKLTPQNLTVTQDVVQVLLEAATFNFVARSLQPTGIASVGDKKRMLFGVGR